MVIFYMPQFAATSWGNCDVTVFDNSFNGTTGYQVNIGRSSPCRYPSQTYL